MRNKIIPVAAAVAITALTVLPVGTAFALPPVYVANKKEDLMITKITPSDGSFEIRYTAEKHFGDNPTYVNFQMGGVSDYDLHMLENRDVTKTMYKNVTSAFISGGMKDGDSFIFPDRLLYYKAKLSMNYSHMIDYYVSFGNSDPQRARADYRRCIDSSVFDERTMECVMEDLGNGFVVYQPYRLTGERVEIPADEDARLLAQTEQWRATPGNWGAEWYVEEPEESEEPVEPTGPEEPVEPEEPGEPVGPENPSEPVEPEEPTEPVEPVEPMEPEGSEEPLGPEGPVEPEGPSEPNEPVDLKELVGPSDSNKPTDSESLISGPLKELDKIVNAGESNTTSSTVSNTASSGLNTSDTVLGELVTLQGDSDEESSEKNQIDDHSGNEVDKNGTETQTVKTGVVVPDLGERTESQPNWAAIIFIILASVAGLVGWLFLFFGKHKSKERKEEKE